MPICGQVPDTVQPLALALPSLAIEVKVDVVFGGKTLKVLDCVVAAISVHMVDVEAFGDWSVMPFPNSAVKIYRAAWLAALKILSV
jgi:hypothetical protein